MTIKDLFSKIVPPDAYPFWKNRAVEILLALAIVSQIVIWVFWIWKMRLIGQIYSPLVTNQTLGNFSTYSLPTFGIIILILNTFLAQYSFSREKIASFFLISTSFFVQILILILIRFYLSQGF